MNATATRAPAGVPPAPSIEANPATCPSRAGGAGTGAPQGGPQYMRALERANQVRLARAELKRRVAAGETSVCEVILRCPWEADSMAIGDLLMSQRRWGQTRCRKFLAQIPMSEQKTIGSMTDRQRHTLAALLSASSPIAVARPWLAAPQVARMRVAGAPLATTTAATGPVAGGASGAPPVSLAPAALARGGR